MTTISNTLNAANIIRDLIAAGQLKPNESIGIDKIANNYDLQKTHVAEAVATLENEGFVTFSPSGPIVRKISKAEIICWLQKRFSVEMDIVEKLTVALDKKKLSIIEESMKEQKEAVQSLDVVKFLELNAEFHFNLASLAGFPLAAHWFKLESARLKISEIKALDNVEKFKACFEEHIAIVNSIKSRQPERARIAMKIHLEKTAERITLNKIYEK